MNKPTQLSFHYFGKTISIKNESDVLHIGEVFDMFRTIIVSEFGQKEWENTILNIGDKMVNNYIKNNTIEI